MKTKYIAVYGSLRPSEYNYERFVKMFGQSEIVPIGTEKITNFKLYSLGAYPGIKLSDNDKDKLIVDILEVSERVYNNIKLMELGAGYIEITKRIGNKDCIIYLYNGYTNEENRVENGDWSEYMAKKKNWNNRKIDQLTVNN